ncbi:MAG: hypothetical protein HY869_03565 [Chloroflexi bacterium]|nr:hypothetical protein [Chloroflexota bacterium]
MSVFMKLLISIGLESMKPNELRMDAAESVKAKKRGALRRRICPSWTKPYLEKEARDVWQKGRKNPKPTDKGTTIGILHENQKPCTGNLAWKDFAKGIKHTPLPSLERGVSRLLIPPGPFQAVARGGRRPGTAIDQWAFP